MPNSVSLSPTFGHSSSLSIPEKKPRPELRIRSILLLLLPPSSHSLSLFSSPFCRFLWLISSSSSSSPLPLSFSVFFSAVSRFVPWPTRAKGVKNRERRRLDGPRVVRHRGNERRRESKSNSSFVSTCIVPPLLFFHGRSPFYRIIEQPRVTRHRALPPHPPRLLI